MFLPPEANRTSASLPGRKENEMKRNVVAAAYVLEIENDIQPKLYGPYKNADTRDGAAKRLRAKDQEDEKGIFALDVMKSGKVRVWAYAAGFVGGTRDNQHVDDDNTGGTRFLNHYRCPDDGTEWSDEWSCTSNDRCPKCNHEIEPYESEDINPPSEPLKSIDRPGARKDALKALRIFGA